MTSVNGSFTSQSNSATINTYLTVSISLSDAVAVGVPGFMVYILCRLAPLGKFVNNCVIAISLVSALSAITKTQISCRTRHGQWQIHSQDKNCTIGQLT